MLLKKIELNTIKGLFFYTCIWRPFAWLAWLINNYSAFEINKALTCDAASWFLFMSKSDNQSLCAYSKKSIYSWESARVTEKMYRCGIIPHKN